jgi:prolyl-tRNA synthetase
MGSYGIGSGRLLACIAEEHHDEQGLVWPVSVAPYQVHLVSLGRKKVTGERGPGIGDQVQGIREETTKDVSVIAERLFADLQAAGLEVLFDDRDESPGVKFNDADLIGLPIRLTVSERSLKAGGVEFKRRDQAEKRMIPLDEVIFQIQAEIAALEAGIAATALEMPFESQDTANH